MIYTEYLFYFCDMADSFFNDLFGLAKQGKVLWNDEPHRGVSERQLDLANLRAPGSVNKPANPAMAYDITTASDIAISGKHEKIFQTSSANGLPICILQSEKSAKLKLIVFDVLLRQK